jgi:molybdopterin-biosynthesis enzyme MoeA-like protein
MGVFPEGASIIANPFNKIPGFSIGDVHFVPGFPVMAYPMIESLLDGRYASLHGSQVQAERSVIVYGAMEASLTPLMQGIEAEFSGVKVFSLPSVDHPSLGRHIELGVKGRGPALDAAYAVLMAGLRDHGATLGAEMVR